MCLCFRSLENDSPWDRWTSPTVVTVASTTEEEEQEEEQRYWDMVNIYKLYTTTTVIWTASETTVAVGYIHTLNVKKSPKNKLAPF